MRPRDRARSALRRTHQLGENDEAYMLRVVARLGKETGLAVTARRTTDGVRVQGFRPDGAQEVLIDVERPSLAAAEHPFRVAAEWAKSKGLY